MANWKDNPELRDIMSQCSMSTRIFAKTFFPEMCSRPFPAVTDPIFKAIDDPSIQKIVIAAFRGFGKTTIMNKAFPAKNIIFRQKKFIVPISCTATLAEQMGDNLKRELRSNAFIQKLFGDIKTDPTAFSKEMFIAHDTLVMPRGSGQQIRGVLSGSNRPDLIIGDDLEDPEKVKNPELRKELKRWFRADVLNAVDKSSKTYKIIVVGTVLHEDSLLVELLNDPDWFHIELPLCDQHYNSFHPDFMSSEQVKNEAESHSRRGELSIFFMEFMNSVIPEDAPFKKQFFKYYEEDGTLTFDREVENIVLCDPAKSTQMQSAYSSIVGIAINMTEHEHSYIKKGEIDGKQNQRGRGIYIRDVVNDRFHPEEFFEAAYQMCKRMGAKVIGVEVSGLDEYMQYPIVTYFNKKGFFPEFVWLRSPSGPTNYKAKEKRVKGLSPFYRQGMIYHNSNGVCTVLENQLLSFPRSKFWDAMDITAYVVHMLEEGSRYIAPDENAEEKYKDAIDRELEELEMENRASDWRII